MVAVLRPVFCIRPSTRWHPVLPASASPDVHVHPPDQSFYKGTALRLPLFKGSNGECTGASASSDVIRCSRVLLSHTLDAALSY